MVTRNVNNDDHKRREAMRAGGGHPVLNGELIEYVGTAVDVTERERLRQLETELAHINRVSMMGELAASLAHDMKQPLTGAAMNANACARWLRRDPPDLKEAREAASQHGARRYV
jgi:C4-dicarboxylate-specific signal transduction histidine kinase